MTRLGGQVDFVGFGEAQNFGAGIGDAVIDDGGIAERGAAIHADLLRGLDGRGVGDRQHARIRRGPVDDGLRDVCVDGAAGHLNLPFRLTDEFLDAAWTRVCKYQHGTIGCAANI